MVARKPQEITVTIVWPEGEEVGRPLLRERFLEVHKKLGIESGYALLLSEGYSEKEAHSIAKQVAELVFSG